MASNTPNNRLEEDAADQNLIEGLNTAAATIPHFVVGGVPTATKDIVTTLQGRLATAKAVTSARAAFHAAVQADRDERAKTKAMVSAVKQTLLASFAGQTDALATFGLKPRKPRSSNPEAQVIAAAKAKATRAARHTMGKKQKSAIKGALDSSVVKVAVPAPVTVPETRPEPTRGA